MKKILAFILAAGMLLCFAACGDGNVETTPSEETPAPTSGPLETTPKPIDVVVPKEFDAENIVFSFGEISDVHIKNSATDTDAYKFESALRQLDAEARKTNGGKGLDAVLSTGDLTDNGGYGGVFSQMSYVKTVYERVFSPVDVPLVYAPGNHDVEWTQNSVFQVGTLNSYLSDDYFLNDVDKDALKNDGNRHCVINGYHVISLVPVTKDPVTYSQTTKTWLDATLASITAENPDQFVFILNHPMIKDTVYGSDLGTFWYTSDLTGILNKYPQVVIFGGHLHFPLNDPRSIMQTDFTAVGSGSVSYMAIESGGYEDMASATTMNDRFDISSGNLVQIDKNGNMRIRRMDFAGGKVIGEDWTVSHPTADRSHLQKYTRARGSAANNTAPVLTDVDVTFGAVTGTRRAATLKFPAGTDDEFVHHYVITFGKKDGTKKTIKILADFYRAAKPSDMKKEWERSLGTLEIGTTYEVTLTAYDSWDAMSNTVFKEITPDSDGVVITPTDIVYVDLDIVDGQLVDTKGHVKVENKGGRCMQTTVTVNGKSAQVPTFGVNARGNYALCTFTEFTTATAVQGFMENGFSVEAFYVMPNKGPAVQGIICGTQDGGWGLAEDKTGKPYFITGKNDGTKSYYNAGAYANSVSSTTELVHVVGVYDFEAKQLSLYVNGNFVVSQPILADYKPGISKAYNKFCVGTDITTDGAGGDFFSTKMTLVDAKIYSTAISAGDVTDAYNNAISIVN